MSILGFVAGAVAKKVVKDVAITVGAAALDVARKVLPKDDEGNSILDVTTESSLENDYIFGVAGAKAEVGAGQIIHDMVHHKNPSDYSAGIPKLVDDNIDLDKTNNEVMKLPPMNND